MDYWDYLAHGAGGERKKHKYVARVLNAPSDKVHRCSVTIISSLLYSNASRFCFHTT